MKSKIICVLTLLFCIGTTAFSQSAYWKMFPKYDDMEIISPDLIMVREGQFYGIIDYDGKIIAETKYTEITPFYDGRSLLLDNDELKGIMNRSGDIISFNANYSVDKRSAYFSEGLLAVQKDKNLWGYLDVNGKEKIPCMYTKAFPFFYGYASVRTKKNYFIHINQDNQISILKEGFKDENMIFASSFTLDPANPSNPFAILVNKKGVVFMRGLLGNKMPSSTNERIKENTIIGGVNRCILGQEYTYLFNPDWTLREMRGKQISRKYKVVEVAADKLEQKNVAQVNSNVGQQQKRSLTFRNKVIFENLFDEIISLRDMRHIVSFNGKYGIIDITAENLLTVKSSVVTTLINHHVPMTLTFDVEVSDFLKEHEIEKMTVIASSGNILNPTFKSGKLSFDYVPTFKPGVDGYSESFDVNYQLEGLTYPSQQIKATFKHENAFTVTWPVDVVPLDSQDVGVFDVIITNTSETISSECEVYVGDKRWATYIFAPGEKKTVQIKKNVDIGDGDSVTELVKISIREKGCPEFVDSRDLVFERYLINEEF